MNTRELPGVAAHVSPSGDPIDPIVDILLGQVLREEGVSILAGHPLPLDASHGARLLTEALKHLGAAGSGNYGHAGRPGKVGGSAPSHDLEAERVAGIQHSERLLKRAVKEADYQNTTAPDWESLSSDQQIAAQQSWEEDQYGQHDIDDRDLRADFERDLRSDNAAIIATTEKAVQDALDREGTMRDKVPVLPFDENEDWAAHLGDKKIDWSTVTVEEDTGDGASLTDIDEVRFTDGTALTAQEQETLIKQWGDHYEYAFDQALQRTFESEKYLDAYSQMEHEYLEESWAGLSDEEKYGYAKDNSARVSPGEPKEWLTGFDENNDPEDYARTNAIAKSLAELRTSELYDERDIGGTVYDNPWIAEPHPTGNPGDYRVRNTVTGAIFGENTIGNKDGLRLSQADAERNVLRRGEKLNESPPEPHRLAENIWSEWKGSSSSDQSLTFQLAVADEFGTHHRIDPEKEAQLRAKVQPNEFDAMKAYARAQWETTQYILHRSGDHEAEVYRGLMLPGADLVKTTNENVANWIRLPDVRLKRAGLQSTTSDETVANSWGGVGDLPPDATRVVLRMRVPNTSVISLPVFGQNIQNERETVVMGAQDPWDWDLWRRAAPTFTTVPLTRRALKTMRAAGQPLVIDLQALDEGQPHWLNKKARARQKIKTLGSASSGNYGHAGRPGKVGGSAPGALRQFTSEEGYQWHEQGPVADWAAALPDEDRQTLQDYAGFGYSEVNNQLRGGEPPMKTTYWYDATPEQKAQLKEHPITTKQVTLPDGTTWTREFMDFTNRSVDTERQARTSKMVEAMNTSIAERGYVLPEDIEVGRAAYIPGISDDELAQMVGQIHEEKGFTSTMVGDAGGRLEGYVPFGKAESLYKRYNDTIGPDGERITKPLLVKEKGTAILMKIEIPKGSKVAAIEAIRQVKSGGMSKGHRTESELLLGSGARFEIIDVRPGGVKRSGDFSTPTMHMRLRYIGGGSSEGTR